MTAETNRTFRSARDTDATKPRVHLMAVRSAIGELTACGLVASPVTRRANRNTAVFDLCPRCRIIGRDLIAEVFGEEVADAAAAAARTSLEIDGAASPASSGGV